MNQVIAQDHCYFSNKSYMCDLGKPGYLDIIVTMIDQWWLLHKWLQKI